MIKTYGLGYLNAWKIILGKETYMITPAHNLIYKKHNNLQISHLIRPKDISGWNVDKRFVDSNDILYDLAWKKLSWNEPGLYSYPTDLSNIVKCNFYYYQPYNYKGVLTNEYNIGCIDGYVYKSPEIDYYESINVGFRGMSGAIVTIPGCNINNFIGMFIRKCENIGMDLNASTIKTETNGISRGLIMPHFIIDNIIKENNALSLEFVL